MVNVPCHIHTSGSALDGAIDIDKYIAKAKELGMEAIGISDHGAMTKCYEFYKKCTKAEIKPIIGCEFYIGEVDEKSSSHLLLIAMNDIGLKNLYKLSKLSHENFYAKPRLTLEHMQTHSEGLICTTACLGGELYKSFKRGKEEAIKYLELMSSIYGDRLYLEMQPNSLPEQKSLNLFIEEMNQKYNYQTIITTDAHYINKEDSVAHDTLICMKFKKKKHDKDRFRFPCDDNYIMSDEEIYSKMTYLNINTVSEAIVNSNRMAKRCDVHIKNDIDLLPKMKGVTDAERTLREHCNTGFKKRMEQGHFKGFEKKAIDRVMYELKVICDKGYAGYFLIVEDFIKYGWEHGIPFGPGRGSVAGSEVAFILEICEIEPIKYGLFFERFINPTRDSQPDIDSDIDYELRHKLIDYVMEEYGKDNVCQINAEGTLTVKAVVRKVLSVYGYEMKVINATCKAIPDKCKTLAEALTYPEVSIRLSRKPELKDMLTLEGLMSHNSTHAAGIIIAPERVDNYIPVRIDRESGMMVSQWHKKIVESLRLYKFDFLGLKQITIFRKTLDDIYKNTGKRITFKELYNIDFEDPNIYKQINEKSLKFVFQLDGDSASGIIEKMKPKCFNDIMVAESICRPGVIEADLYLSNKQLHDKYGSYPVPEYYNFVSHILDESYGCIVYQEQTMELFHESGNFTLGEADALRKVPSLDPYRDRFVSGWVNKGMTLQMANELFDRFDLGYVFNKSHACVYGLVTIICAWLKWYYPREYLANAMTVELLSDEPDINAGIKDAIKNNIKILPPMINKSTNAFNPTEEGITFPLSIIPYVGDKAYECIQECKPYTSLNDFMLRVNKTKVNKRIMKNLIKAGCFDEFDKNRSKLLEEVQKAEKKKELVPFWCDETLLAFEKQIYGFSLTKHPLDGHINTDITEEDNDKLITINCIVLDNKEHTDKNGNKMCFLKLENKVCNFDGVIFSYCYPKLKNIVGKGAIVTLKGKKEGNNLKISEGWVL